MVGNTNAINVDVSTYTDGFAIGGGTSNERTLTLGSGDITLIGGNTGSSYVFPSVVGGGSVILNTYGSFGSNVYTTGSYYGYGGTLTGVSASGVYTLLGSYYLAGVSAETLYTVPAGIQFFKIAFTMDISPNGGGSNSAFSMRVNGQTSGYTFVRNQYSTISNRAMNWLELTGSSSGHNYGGGEIYLPRYPALGNSFLPITGNASSTDTWVYLGGYCNPGGSVATIGFRDYGGNNIGSFTGSIYIWGM